MKSYTHIQSTPATTWNITHNLDCVPVGDVINSSGVKVIPKGIEHVDSNTLQVTFNTAVSGSMRLVGKYVFSLAAGAGSIDPTVWP